MIVTTPEIPASAARSRRELRERERGIVAPARSAVRTGPRRTVGSRLLSFLALTSAAAFLVGASVPATALGVLRDDEALAAPQLAATLQEPGQALAVAGDASDAIGDRDEFEVRSWAQVLRDRYGPRSYSYTVGNGGSIRWPFPYYVPISDGYGPRPAPCAGCSTMHLAIDLTPGAGAPIYAIADGVVVKHEPRTASWGNFVTIEHRIDGHVVTSSYAHMQFDSSPLQVGDVIKVGDFVGLTGSTGEATGAHLHLEIMVDGEHVNPLEWLTQYAG